eukprot:RCo001896
MIVPSSWLGLFLVRLWCTSQWFLVLDSPFGTPMMECLLAATAAGLLLPRFLGLCVCERACLRLSVCVRACLCTCSLSFLQLACAFEAALLRDRSVWTSALSLFDLCFWGEAVFDVPCPLFSSFVRVASFSTFFVSLLVCLQFFSVLSLTAVLGVLP